MMHFSTHVFLAGVELRPHQAEDKACFASTPHDAEFFLMTGSALPSSQTAEEEAEVWFQKKAHLAHSWAIEVDSRCVGSTWIHSVEPANRRGRFAIEIFNGSYRGKGIGLRVTEAVVQIAFEELLLHRLDLRVLTINEPAIRLYERCGFKREGVQRDTLFHNGRWYSDLWMSLLEEEYYSAKAMIEK